MRYLDTNVILRYLVRDDDVRAAACYELFQRVNEGLEELTTCEAVITEAVYVLSGRKGYHLPRETVRDLLRPIIAMQGLRLHKKRIYSLALDIYVTHPQLDYEDALIVAHMQDAGMNEVVTYDRDFDRIPGVLRAEPIP